MFTGLVASVGKVHQLSPQGGDVRLWVHMGELDLQSVTLGDSIAVSGVCLTVVEKKGQLGAFDVSNETLRCSALGQIGQGDAVNLETALTLSTPLGGHLVAGHVDGIGTVLSLQKESRSWCVKVQVPADLVRYLAPKGSITLDGISLTVNGVVADSFTVNIIPHTFTATTVQYWSPGRRINLEVDLIARYVEALMKGGVQPAVQPGGVTMDLLQKSGFVQE